MKKLLSVLLVILMLPWGFAHAAELAAPQNPSWKSGSTATATWDAVEGADYYELTVYVYDKAGTNLLGSTTTGTSATEVDVQQEANIIIKQQETEYTSVRLAYTVKAGVTDATNGEITYGAESAMSEKWDYTYAPIQLPAPSNITLNSAGTAFWDHVENTSYYQLLIIGYSDEACSDNIGERSPSVFSSRVTVENGLCNYNLANEIQALYNDAVQYNRITSGQKIWIRFRMVCYPETGSQYIKSESSAYSDVIEYVPHTPVESLTLSPSKPALYVGNSIYLGKTITPEDAYYTTIDWTSDNESFVTVDDAGMITGIAKGTANVTAAIDNVSCTVPVTVYTISSNIEDEDDKDHVTDSAGDIIDDIVNNENPDLSDTDIPEEDLGNIRDEIQEGLERGDEFFTDMKWYEEHFVKYKNNWGQIQKAARELNAQFAGAYNIEVEMYHKKDDGATHKIGCIEEFENEITFAFDLPTGMSEIQSGYARKYVLVRIHRNEIEAIDMEVKNGKVTAESNGFSDFILLYVDEKTESGVEIKPVADNVMSGAIDTSAMKAEEVDKFYESVLDPKDADQDVDIFLEVNELNKKAITDTVVKSIEDRMDEEDELVAYLDINLLKSVNDGELDPIKTLSKPIPITIELDKVVKGRTYYIIRVHEDEVTRIDGTLKGNKFTFYTDKFSTYALASEITPVHHAHHQGSSIKVQYLSGNSFSTTNSDTPIAVEIDGIPVSFIGNGKYFTVDCIQPCARWVTVKWRGITVTTNFTPDVTVACTQLGLPKTGDASLLSYALLAVISAAVAIRKK